MNLNIILYVIFVKIFCIREEKGLNFKFSFNIY